MSLEPSLTLSQRIQLAAFAFSVEQNQFISVLVGGVKLKPLLRLLKRDYCCEDCSRFKNYGPYHDVFGMLSELHTTFALRAIRGSRPRNIRNDEDDGNKTRRYSLARVHEKLGRYALAEKLRKPLTHK